MDSLQLLLMSRLLKQHFGTQLCKCASSFLIRCLQVCKQISLRTITLPIFSRACGDLMLTSHPIQVDKVAEAEHEVYDAGTRLETAQDAYETIVRRMSQELARFQKERAEETMHLLQTFARSQVLICGSALILLQ